MVTLFEKRSIKMIKYNLLIHLMNIEKHPNSHFKNLDVLLYLADLLFTFNKVIFLTFSKIE